MSYNTRRNVGGGYNASPQSNVGNIGQRRPVVTNNFVPGGTLTPQKKPVVTPPAQQQQRTPQQQNQTGINFRNQQNQQQQQQQPAPQQQNNLAKAKTEPAQTPTRPVQQQQPPAQQVQQPTPPKQEEATPLAPSSDNGLNDSMEQGSDGVAKRPWLFKKGVKLSKKEKQRRRNIRLSKMLQPKNAVMILNELVRSPIFTITDLPEEGKNLYRAAVMIDNIEHTGTGRSKNQAKNNAAESAIRYLIKNRKIQNQPSVEEDGSEKMDVDDNNEAAPLPWQHVASLALFKLFSSWGEDTRGEEKVDHRPAKNMPPNPEQMQPLMLLNQMLPHVEFEEMGKTGNPPYILFTFRCKVNGEVFEGTGPSKKIAKKYAAFAACHKILNVNYPPDVWSPVSS